jgi:hypothetical protein
MSKNSLPLMKHTLLNLPQKQTMKDGPSINLDDELKLPHPVYVAIVNPLTTSLLIALKILATDVIVKDILLSTVNYKPLEEKLARIAKALNTSIDNAQKIFVMNATR